MGRNMVLRRLRLPPDNPVLLATQERLHRALGLVEARLGEADHLAGREFTAADIMAVFSLTTMRVFLPLDLAPVSQHPRLPATHRRPSRLSKGHAERRPGHDAPCSSDKPQLTSCANSASRRNRPSVVAASRPSPFVT